LEEVAVAGGAQENEERNGMLVTSVSRLVM